MKFSKFTIVDICNQIVSGGTPLTKITEYYGGNICWLKTKEVNFNRIYNTEFKITELGLENSSAKIIPENSIIIAMYGNGDTAGRCAINKIPLATNQACCNLIIDESKADYVYIYYLIKSKYEELVNLKNGGAQQNLSLQLIKEIEILLPELDTQKKIGNVLSSYDDLIENNLKRIKLLEETAELIYKEWFVNFRFPGHEKCKFVDGIPEGWEKSHLSEIVSTQYGFTESARDEDTGIKYLRGTDINKTSYINWSDVPWCSIEDTDKFKYQLKKYDIVVIRMADPGKVGIVEKDIDAVFASYLIRLKIDITRIKPYYLFYFLNSDFYQKFISQSSTGATRKSANAKLITDVDLIIPSKVISEQFENKISDLRELLNNLLEQNQKLKEARDILIPKLIMGEIEV